MNKLVLLDTGTLGMITHPRANPQIADWISNLLQSNIQIKVPEICDYELRRELIRSGKTTSVDRLDSLISFIGLIALNRDSMLKAAELWARARNQGFPTASDESLDADVILAAQAEILKAQGHDTVVATDNVDHLSRFTNANEWKNISIS